MSVTFQDASEIIGVTRPIAKVIEAFRSGDGVPFPEYGADLREGLADGNRVMFVNSLAQEWLPALGALHDQLGRDPSRILDVGCGAGYSTLAIAATYPKAAVVGIAMLDSDEAMVDAIWSSCAWACTRMSSRSSR